MPAKISRNVVRKLIPSSRPDTSSSAALSPVSASTSSGISGAACFASSSCETPSSAVIQKLLKTSSPPRNSCCAVSVSKAANVAPLSEPPSANPAMPTRVGVMSSESVDVTIDTRSPTS